MFFFRGLHFKIINKALAQPEGYHFKFMHMATHIKDTLCSKANKQSKITNFLISGFVKLTVANRIHR